MGIQISKFVCIPINLLSFLNEKEGSRLNKEQHSSYKRMTESLMYLVTPTRPDLTAAATMVASHTSQQTWAHFTCAERVLCYLMGTANY